MAYKIKSLAIDATEYSFLPQSNLQQQNGRLVLDNLSKINFFVGANNSGKSRLLRKIFSSILEDTYYITSANDDQLFNNIAVITNNIIKNNGLIKAEIPYSGQGHMSDYMENNILEYRRLLKEVLLLTSGTLKKNFEKKDEVQSRIKMFIESQNVTPAEIINKTNEIILYLQAHLPPLLPCYIPTMRGLKRHDAPLKALKIDFMQISQEIRNSVRNNALLIDALITHIANYDLYKEQIHLEYFKNIKNYQNKKDSFFTGLSFYNDVRAMLLGTQEERKNLGKFESFLSENFFGGAEVSLVPYETKKDEKNILNIKIGNEEQRHIHDLGDGIQTIITLTFPLFKNLDEDLLVFIEEPELNLHPGMQKIFIDTIMNTKGFENFQFFIATHSNHFLDMTLDHDNISIYTLRKEVREEVVGKENSKFIIEYVKNDSTSSLELLGVRQSSVFLANCTIWVEGITDRLYLRKYLEIYMNSQPQKFKENIHYTFAEYGGANIAHWNFLDEEDKPESVSPKVLGRKYFLVTDHDNHEEKGTKKSERIKKFQEVLGKKQYCCLKVREIENSLSKLVISEISGVNDISKIDENAYMKEDKYIGEYFSKLQEGKALLPICKFNKKKDGTPTTIANKVEFCRAAIKIMTDSEDNKKEGILSSEAIRVAGEIYEFIRESNK